jgi:membrane protease YdiL (CAAX protease family)
MTPALRWILIVVLAGLYFVVWHTPPLPGNHEDVGLGKTHLAHDVIGVALLAVAGYVWWSARKKHAAPAAT